MGIGVSGLATGLDTDSIISKIMDLERRPETLLKNRESAFQAKITGIGTLKGALSSFQSAVQALEDSDNFTSYSIKSSNRDILTASSSGTPSVGQYQITVTQLAQAQQLRSAAFTGTDTVVGTGTITLQVGADTPVDVTIDSTNNTLSGIASAINDADAGVVAGIVNDGNGNYYLTLVGQKTGADNTISVSIADDDGNNTDASGLSSIYSDPSTQSLTETQAALNAQLNVNGIDVERSENSISDLVEGVTIQLQKADASTPVTVDITRNSKGLEKKLDEFVTQYNNLIKTINGLQSYNPETKEAGSLLGDSTVNRLRTQITSYLYRKVDGIPDDFNGLSKYGIQIDRQGVMSLDTSAVEEAMENDPDAVKDFFARDSDGIQGLAVQLDTVLDGYLNETTGILSAKSDSLNSSIKSIENQIDSMEARLAKREENLRKQFESLETLMSSFQKTSSTLDQQLASLADLRTAISKK